MILDPELCQTVTQFRRSPKSCHSMTKLSMICFSRPESCYGVSRFGDPKIMPIFSTIFLDSSQIVMQLSTIFQESCGHNPLDACVHRFLEVLWSQGISDPARSFVSTVMLSISLQHRRCICLCPQSWTCMQLQIRYQGVWTQHNFPGKSC